MRRFLRLLMAALLACGAVWHTAALQSADITEWPVAWENTRPRDPYVDSLGRVWFVGQTGDYVAFFQPRTGEFRRYELERGTGRHNLTVDAADRVWYAGNRSAHIGLLDPESGRITRYPTPAPAARDPHTMVFDGQDGIWFTAPGGNSVGRISMRTGEVTVVSIPLPGSRPYGITADAAGRPWINLFGTNKIATVNPTTMQVETFDLGRPQTRSRRIGLASDGAVWYVDYSGGFLGRLDPATGGVKEWRVPGGAGAQPYAMAVDDRDRIWFVESGRRPNRLVGFDPRAEEFFAMAELGSGGGTVRHMVFHAPTRELWFGTDTNQLGRARLP